MIALLARAAAVALLGLHALQWCVCPVCGAGFSGLAPGEPCSSGCAAKQRQDRALGGGGGKVTSKDSGAHVGGTGKHRVPAKGGNIKGGGGGGARDDGGCFELVLLPAAATVLALIALVRRKF